MLIKLYVNMKVWLLSLEWIIVVLRNMNEMNGTIFMQDGGTWAFNQALQWPSMMFGRYCLFFSLNLWALFQVNIWNDNINNEVNDSHPKIPITKIINIEHYDLQFDFVIQLRNVSNQKSSILKDENFTKFSYSMMMEEFEYFSLLKQLNE